MKTIPFAKMVFAPFYLLGDNTKSFLMLASIYAIILSIVAYILGGTYACIYAIGQDVFFPCAQTWFELSVFGFAKILIVSLFTVHWVGQVFSKEQFDFKSLVLIDIKTIKTFGIFVLLAIVCLVPMLSLFLLYIRVPNPNWKIELAYFSLVSLGFILPFIATRFLSILGFVAQGVAVPRLRQIWQNSQGNSFRILISLFLILFFLMLAFLYFNGTFRSIAENFTYYNVLTIDFLYNLLLFLMVAFFINHCMIQKEYLFEENINENN